MTASAPMARVAPPTFVELAAHPIRWRLLVELARGDRQVQELTALLGRRQGLVSYHLGRLRAGGLVSARQSSFDRRVAYYHVCLEWCGESLSSAGASLHPGLSLQRAPTKITRTGGGRRHIKVLFLCTGNSARSQIAEALLKHAAGDRIEVVSAGRDPKPVHPNAVKVLAERGVDIRGWRSKPFTLFTGQRFDYVITLCDKVREDCPEFPGVVETIHWSIEDPSDSGGTDRSTYPTFSRITADLETRIGFLISLIDEQSSKEHFRHAK
jgi:protein-tyrosine-phosphatase/DNA-binding transcriptional ArsR family regulator